MSSKTETISACCPCLSYCSGLMLVSFIPLLAFSYPLLELCCFCIAQVEPARAPAMVPGDDHFSPVGKVASSTHSVGNIGGTISGTRSPAVEACLAPQEMSPLCSASYL